MRKNKQVVPSCPTVKLEMNASLAHLNLACLFTYTSAIKATSTLQKKFKSWKI